MRLGAEFAFWFAPGRTEALTMLPSPSQDGVTSVLLRRILPHAEFYGCRDVLVTTISTDASRIQPGGVFIALGDEGHEQAAIAVARGAAAIVCERFLNDGSSQQVVVGDTLVALGQIAHALEGAPSEFLPIVGVHGASSSLAIYLQSIFGAALLRVGTASKSIASRGPRNSCDIAETAAAMLESANQLGLLEFSTEELTCRAADGFQADSALIFAPTESNEESRRQELVAIARLTRSVRSGGSIAVQADDPIGDLLLASNPEARVVTFGLDGSGDISAILDETGRGSTRIRLTGLDRDQAVELGPIGLSTLYAALGAVAIARGYELSDDVIVAGLEAAHQNNFGLDSIAVDWATASRPLDTTRTKSTRRIRKIA